MNNVRDLALKAFNFLIDTQEAILMAKVDTPRVPPPEDEIVHHVEKSGVRKNKDLSRQLS